jgi:phosphatidylserine/phosphatidylglycerophosphate/cardiolipin synthase-like enzyme
MMSEKNLDRGQSRNDNDIAEPNPDAEQTNSGITRRQLLQAGAGALAGLALAGVPSATADEDDGIRPLTMAQGMRWFDTSLVQGDGVTPCRVWQGNEVLDLIDGPQTFWNMVQAIKTTIKPDAAAKGYFVYLLNWWATDSFPLLPRDPNFVTPTMNGYLTAASTMGVQVRAMLWKQALVPGQNEGEVNRINGLANGAAILDGRHVTGVTFQIPVVGGEIRVNIGAHHQKILIVYGSEGLIAFCGGIDINPDRLFRNAFPPGSPARTEGDPLHDIHCRIKGPAAIDLLRILVQRWLDHPDHVALDAAKGALRALTVNIQAPARGTNLVQIGRTFGNGNRYLGIDARANTTFPFIPPLLPVGYTFAPNGEQTAAQMILKGIQEARKFIYVEDQYFVDTAPNAAGVDVRAALRAALPRIEHLTVVIPDSSITDLTGIARQIGNPTLITLTNQAAYRRRELIAALKAVGGNKVRVFFLKRPLPGSSHTYVHSKTWIFDDEFVIIGSANCNRRSWTHDSEVVAGICDLGDGRRLRMPVRLRMRLWAEHLNLDNLEKVRNGVQSANLWLDGNRPPLAPASPYLENDLGPFPQNAIQKALFDADWTFIDPDGS